MKMHKLTIAATCLFVVLLSGCGEEVVVKRIKPAPPEAADVEPVEDITAALAEFEPPPPEQVILFEPDVKKRTKAADSTIANSSGSEPDVELMGFGSVDSHYALLLIDGQMEALRVGEKLGNVQVLKIEPPRVQLNVAGRKHVKTLASDHDA